MLKSVVKVMTCAMLLGAGAVHGAEQKTDLLQSCVNGRVAGLAGLGEVSSLNPTVVERILNECQMATGIRDAQRACVAGERAQNHYFGGDAPLDSAALEEACS